MSITRSDRVHLPVSEWRCDPIGVCPQATNCARRMALIPMGAVLKQQAYAEGFDLMRHKSEFGLDVQQIAEIWRNGSVVPLLPMPSSRSTISQPIHSHTGMRHRLGDNRAGRLMRVQITAPIKSEYINDVVISGVNAEGTIDNLVAAINGAAGAGTVMMGGHAAYRASHLSYWLSDTLN